MNIFTRNGKLIIECDVAPGEASSTGKSVKVGGTNAGKGGTETITLPNGQKLMISLGLMVRGGGTKDTLPTSAELANAAATFVNYVRRQGPALGEAAPATD